MKSARKSSHPKADGQIVAAFGRSYLVETADGGTVSCVARGKKGGLACGDRVTFSATGRGEGVIENALPRASLLYRSDAFREKLIAANVTQVMVVVAPVPRFSEDLISRCLVAAEHQHLRAVILLNKCDLAEQARAALESLALYRELGYPLLTVSAKHDVSPLLPWLSRQTTVLVGQSGMGKSTLINALTPEAAAATAEISAALDSGRHTTTSARLYHLDAENHLIDSPGMQEFGLGHLGLGDLAYGFVEFRPWLGQCKFNDCRHLGEPACAVSQAQREGKISAQRLASYRRLVRELAAHRPW
ncbi:MAG: ribosome small subunit-dependent GTPase A [Betaproteobacteria bacterium]|nr:ribosome small subunit-dependent GTPase A [Betaproteobacteria bacterium]